MTQPWYPFYWGDYSSKTLHLSLSQHGAYLLLLRFTYTTEKPIPHQHRYSIARAMLEHEQEAVDFVLDSFFQRRGDSWHNVRAEEIISESNVKHAKRVSAGAKGGKSKSSNARAKLKQSGGTALATTPTATTDSVADATSSPPTPKPPRVGLDDLSVDHVAGWLAEKRGQGRYVHHDEHFVLEQFKTYCQSKGKRYADYVAGYRNAFEWERCQPRHAKPARPSTLDILGEATRQARAAREQRRTGPAG